jgi:hypothetical protein
MKVAPTGRDVSRQAACTMNLSLPSPKSTSRPTRALKLVSGFALLIVGGVLALPGVPGPGIPIILLGLWVLSDHFAWPKGRLPGFTERTARLRRNQGRGAIVANRNGQ